MVPPPYVAEPGHWFLRGVQSAIFYYVSFTPCLEYQHKRKRRKEAQAHSEIINTQPGLVRQPGPFQTNEEWAEELMLGPGPPRGWKADELLQKLKKSDTADSFDKPQTPVTPELPELHLRTTTSSQQPSLPQTQPSTRPSSTETEDFILDHSDDKSNASQKRPSMDRRLSIAMENIKDSLRATLNPDTWNWKRYDREDEVLWGFGERMTRMWNRALRPESGDDQENEASEDSPRRRKRALTNESDRYDYHRARNPALNELHPPVVSQLPATRDQAAWMMLPPPSAAVMAGKKRPGTEIEMRWPLAVIGKPLKSSESPRSVLATTYSREALDSEDDAGLSDIDLDNTSIIDFFGSGSTPQQGCSTKVKHMSDPIIRPPAIHAKEPFYDDAIVPKRRGSWHIHYYYHSDQ
ncbi:hypothetical protein LTR84_001354 [Exophiala bonariae]|uniref:Rrn9 domain-containing protein n=1 Tax=Exophiala bonariae TaxID=1690606 RepID=A0AAV9NEW3_9EURO|nr:hypothetical protein LTR84_001354 [Exophiala bonariae]